MKRFLFVCFLILGILHRAMCMYESCKDITTNSPLMQLRNYLFCTDRMKVPSRNTTVNFEFHMQHFTVDEYASFLDLHFWMRWEWKDKFLTWTPSNYDDINWIEVKTSDIWIPKTTLYNSAYLGTSVEIPRQECSLHYSGLIVCKPRIVYSTFCTSDRTWWPYDVMNCSIHIDCYSYSANGGQINIVKKGTEANLLMEMEHNNTQWDVFRVSVNEYETRNSTLLSYNILLKRYDNNSNMSSITIAIVFMIVTLMVLWLEPKSIERMIIANLNFVLHLLGMLELQWMLPFSGSNVPKLLLFYEKSFLVAAFSLILTSILRHLQELTIDAPVWISSISVFILKSRVGQIFLVSFLDPKVSARIELNADDNTNLVSHNRKESTWRYTSILIGWLAFLSILFTYIILLVVFLPTRVSFNSLY
ncbi:nicotinic acetylcholine receptor beta2 subunit [Colletes latitarsis]|uniref:nicotinic acetylcholine receptor beta2 subunit n=1 Tax=Colletes latitarsis TaxID=2605962 RepID=UPI0040371B7B